METTPSEASPVSSPSLSDVGDNEESEGIFEIVDFTLSSSWERFISSLEEVIRQWTTNTSLPLSTPLSETLNFAGRSYTLSYHYYPCEIKMTTSEALLCSSLDYPSPAHHITRWFGLYQFFVLGSVADSGASHSEGALLVSSLTIALDNLKCNIPFFVGIEEKWKAVYIGYQMDTKSMTCINFKSELKYSIPPHANTLGKLTQIFFNQLNTQFVKILLNENHFVDDIWKILNSNTKDKNHNQNLQKIPLYQELSKILIGGRFTYMRGNFKRPRFHTPSYTIDHPISFPTSPSHNFFYEKEFLIGEISDTMEAIHLSLTWAAYYPKEVHDFSFFLNEYNPANYPNKGTPEWSVKVVWRDYPKRDVEITEKDQTLIVKKIHWKGFCKAHIKNLVNMFEFPEEMMRKKMSESCGTVVTEEERDEEAKRKNRVGEAAEEEEEMESDEGIQENFFMAMKNIAQNLNSSAKFPSAESIDLILKHLFEKDLDGEAVKEEFENAKQGKDRFKEFVGKSNDEMYVIKKGAPTGSLLSSLTASLLNLEGIYALALLWKEFVSEVRWHFEHKMFLPNIYVYSNQIDYRCSVLHQKLQLINCCVDKLISSTSSSPSKNSNLGRKEILEGIHLLEDLESPVWIPVTQELGMLTEDQILANEQKFAKLGTSDEAAKERAKIQSASLLSDMQAFKAANPSCVLADFIRWYSPSDFLISQKNSEDESNSDGDEKIWDLGDGKEGKLSVRMKDKNGLWWVMWDGCEELEVSKQEKLWDPQKEGAKAVEWLEDVRVGDFLVEILNITFGMVIGHMESLQVSEVDIVKQEIDNLKRELTRFDIRESSKQDLCTLFNIISETEITVTRALSLYTKFSPSPPTTVLQSLLPTSTPSSATLLLTDPKLQSLISSFFESDQKGVLSTPEAKEYIFRTAHKRPVDVSKECGNRMYALLTQSEFRLATGYSVDQ